MENKYVDLEAFQHYDKLLKRFIRNAFHLEEEDDSDETFTMPKNDDDDLNM